MTNNRALVVDHLGKSVSDALGALTILDDISFTIEKGESVAITGASGSGKSTLLGLLAGLDSPTSGSVSVNGVPIYDLDEDGRAAFRSRHVGFVFQSFELLSNLSALENVMLALELRNMSAKKAAIEMLERVGLSERLHAFPATLSGGEQQRVSLARAFVGHPTIIFADEPTGSLDETTGARVIDLMFEMHRINGTTLILVTHDLTLAQRCTRQLKIQNGRLVEG